MAEIRPYMAVVIGQVCIRYEMVNCAASYLGGTIYRIRIELQDIIVIVLFDFNL